ncbi:MAG: ATP-binding protein [Chitinophagaceae bacterium]
MASNRFIYYVLAAFIAGNLLLIFIQYNSSKKIDTLIAGNEQVVNEFKVEEELRDLRRNIVTVEAQVAIALKSKDTMPVPGLQQQINAIESNLVKLQKINDNDSSVKFIDQLDDIIHEKIYFNNKALNILYHYGRNAPDTLVNYTRGKELTDSITLITHKLDSSRRQLLTGIAAEVDQSGRSARRWGSFLFVMVACSGAALFWFIINRVRRQNQLITQLDASEKQVKEAARVKENFMANMSHEIRTPLNAIIGFTSLLKKKTLDETSAGYVTAIQQSGENLLTIVNDILDISKFEAGMMRIELVVFSLRELLHSIETMFLQKTKEKKISLSITADEDVPNLLEGDASRLTQILVNLVGNAIKFTDSGSITVTAKDNGTNNNTIQLSFAVTDTGIGISEDELSGIFERFKQAEASITRKYGGTGLGLSIVKDLVTLQNGSITVESTPGKGSTFRFIIPYKVVDQDLQIIPASQIYNTLPESLQPAKILVVEDNEINQSLMKHLLGSWGLTYTIAESGMKAIEYLQQESFDLILMDIQMPEMDGYSTAQEIRQTLRLNTPIVAMTAHAMAGEREKCISLGMNDYISKPIKESVLLNTIVQFVQATVNEKKKNEQQENNFKCISLQYMREISNGNTEYEKLVTEQFIESIPEDLAQLETALLQNDYNSIQSIAHNMKTTVSIMGLTDKMTPLLDTLEYDTTNEIKLRKTIDDVKHICKQAMEEARTFYTSL